MFANKTAVINIREHAHQKLAVHAIGHPSMSWYAITEVFNVERTFKARGKEATEWRHERGETRHEKEVELVRRVQDGCNRTTNQGRQARRQRRPDDPVLPDEDWIRSTRRRAPRTNSQIVDGAYHIIIAHEIRAPKDAKHNSTPEGAHKAFNSFFGESLMSGVCPMVMPQM